MATLYSQQLLQTEQAEGHNPLSPNETGKVRRLWFEFNTTDDLNGVTLAEGDVIELVRIPKGYRVHGGKVFFEAMGTDQQADIGLKGDDGSGYISADDSTTADDPDFFTTAPLDVAAAGEAEFGVLQEDNPGYATEKDVVLTATLIDSTSSDPWAADKDFNGYVDIVGF